MKRALDSLPGEAKKRLEKVQQPDWVEPMLATRTDRRFSDEDWIFERKLDGERCLAFRSGHEVHLMSRNRTELNGHYPELLEAVTKGAGDRFIVDGEVVALEDGVTSFSRLQKRMHIGDSSEARQSDITVYCYIFDLLYWEGYDTTRVDQRHRKSLLKRVISFEEPLRFVQHRNREGESYFDEVCRKGWGGIMAKDAGAAYVDGRSTKWLKFKCANRQEFVIGGYTEPHGERVGLGALVVGYYQDEDLIYAGKVGTGFDDETLRRLGERLDGLERGSPAFAEDDLPPIARCTGWSRRWWLR